MLSPQAVVLARLLLQQLWLWAVHCQCLDRPPEQIWGEELKAHCRAASHGEEGLCCAGSHCMKLRCLRGDKSQLWSARDPSVPSLKRGIPRRVCLWDGVCWHFDSTGNGIVSSLAGDPNCPKLELYLGVVSSCLKGPAACRGWGLSVCGVQRRVATHSLCLEACGRCHHVSLSPWCWQVHSESSHRSWHMVESPEAPLKSF